MARRNTSAVEILCDTLTKLPPWVSLILGAMSYGALVWLQGGHVPANGNPALLIVSQIPAPLVLCFFVMFALISMVHRQRQAKRVDQQTGLDSLRHTHWKEFEYLVAEAFRRQGYTASYSLNSGPDGGVDVILKKGGRLTLVQCKQWKTAAVGVKVVREMYGILHDQKADEVIIITTGGFTADAEAFAKGKPIKLIDGGLLWEMVKQVQGGANAAPAAMPEPPPFRHHAAVESAAPECPKCGGEMVQRTAKTGATAGALFWGCSRYPRCRGSVSIQESLKPCAAA